MKDKRILYVSSEVIPYLPETEISSTSFEAAKMVNNIDLLTWIKRIVRNLDALIESSYI